jgi:uncharacterized Zn-binding protein involved in type VI secretion
MPNPIVAGTLASCGDAAVGTSTVFVNGKPLMKIGEGLVAGVPIIGPGSSSFGVFVNGIPVSLVGDSITGHGDGSHASPTFQSSPDATTVNIG